MKKVLLVAIILVIPMLFCSACSLFNAYQYRGYTLSLYKSGDDIYIAGTLYAGNLPSACAWKNSNRIFTDSASNYSTGWSVAVNGADVHVVGQCNNHAGYWKNGALTMLPDQPQSVPPEKAGARLKTVQAPVDSTAECITISGTNIYIGGFYGQSKACYWLNGVLVPLTNGRHVREIAISGTNCYAMGSYGNDRPCFWLNGSQTILPLDYFIRDLLLVSNQVYAAVTPLYYSSSAMVWGQNGYSNTLTGLEATNKMDVTSLYLADDGSLYAAGEAYLGQTNVACYWKNGQLVSVGDKIRPSRAWGIIASGSDIYLSGEFWTDTAYSQDYPCYWKNGAMTVLQ